VLPLTTCLPGSLPSRHGALPLLGLYLGCTQEHQYVGLQGQGPVVPAAGSEAPPQLPLQHPPAALQGEHPPGAVSPGAGQVCVLEHSLAIPLLQLIGVTLLPTRPPRPP